MHRLRADPEPGFDSDGDGATYTVSSDGVVTGDAGDAYYNGGKGWTPIGTSANRFIGIFDGNGKTISNRFIKDTSVVHVGLFGNIGAGGRIKRLGIRNLNVSGGNDGGGLVGFKHRGMAADSYWDTGTTGQSTDGGGGVGAGKTTRDLQSLTGYIANGIYASWNVNLGGIAGNDDPWDFGVARQYPALRCGGLDPAQQRQTAIRSDNWNAPVVGEPVVAGLNATGAAGGAYIRDDVAAYRIAAAADVGMYLRAYVYYAAGAGGRCFAARPPARQR